MIKALCVDDTKRPDEIPIDKWVVANNMYHITHVYKLPRQGGILGFGIKEISLETIPNCPYNCYRADRFGIAEKDIRALFRLAVDCGELNDVNILEAIKEELELYDKEVENA